MTWRISMIPYGNMSPYRLLGPPSDCVFVDEFPRASVDSLRSGAVLASCVPVGGLPALQDQVEYVGAYGIAAARQVQSTLVLSRVPFDELGASHTLWVTDETASSVRLLCLLLGRRRGFDNLPRRTENQPSATAILLIGDRALVAYAQDGHLGSAHYPFIVDLATEWYLDFGLPFVFARWVVRRDAPAAAKETVASWLDEFRRREAQLVEQTVPLEAVRLGLPVERVRAYHQHIRRVLGPDDLKGQETFLHEWANSRRALAAGQVDWVAP